VAEHNRLRYPVRAYNTSLTGKRILKPLNLQTLSINREKKHITQETELTDEK